MNAIGGQAATKLLRIDIWNLSADSTDDADDDDARPPLKWGMLSLSIFIVFTALGNILVCLAVCWERRLQNMTNYFLMSLAIADFLVSILVMPVGMTVEIFNGLFPMGPHLCALWATFDVGLCTASIWHMCTMSMDRFFTLKYPMKYGRNKTKTMVLLKITFVWIVSIAICSPVCVLGFIDHDNVYVDGMCMITLVDFVIYASVLAFYVPLTIMIITYVLTIRILRNNSKFMRRVDKNRQTMLRRNINLMNAQNHHHQQHQLQQPQYNNQKFLSAPNGYSSYDNEISNDNSVYVTQSRDSSIVDPKDLAALMSRDVGAKLPPIPHTPAARENSSSVSYAQSSDGDPRQPLVLKPEISDASSSTAPPVPPTNLHDRLNSITSCPETGAANKHNVLMSYLSLPGASSRNLCASVESLVSIHGKDILEAPAEVQEKLSQIELEMEEYLEIPEPDSKSGTVAVGTEDSHDQPNDKRSMSENVTFQSFDGRREGNNLGKSDTDASIDYRHQFYKIVPHDRKSLPRLKTIDNGPLTIHRGQGRCWQTTTTAADNVDVNRRKSYGDAFVTRTTTISDPMRDDRRRFAATESCSSSDEDEEDSDQNLSEESDEEEEDDDEVSDNDERRYEDGREDGRQSEPEIRLEATTENSEIVTLSLETNGIYVYRVNYMKRPARENDRLIRGENHTSTDSDSYVTAPNGHVTSPCNNESTDARTTGDILVNGVHHAPVDRSADEWRERVLKTASVERQHQKRWSRQSDSSYRQTPPHFKDKKQQQQNRINVRGLIPKRTANNEKKASKVLGIIFVVFVVLWTPFFVVNVLSVSCAACMARVTPEMMSAFLWFGYLASLANPIIYTMFNTSFRNAFYKIITCKYRLRRRARGERRSSQQPESMFLTPSNWISDTRRNTVTYTLNIKEV
ncbi:uncharacterized protein LOC141911158 [Tubulanus polymorphus]|uniref:uncharacterized protein LOC141911158 n=1 Tax=Tubulanus polymorphus TaxID=672921 RepID=UPI003DA22ADA